MTRRLSAACLLAALLLVLPGCSAAYWLGIRLYYDKALLPSDHTFRDLPYDPSAPGDHKRQLDLFVPDGRDFPTVIFLHGGGWAWGDRSQTFGGADIYGNIGRFLAQQGFGAAVPSYRLIWTVDWRTQLADVARAVAWVQHNIAARGGRADALFLMGHSAGAQLAMRIAADPSWLEAAGGDPAQICGVVAVSGAAYDLEDGVSRSLEPDAVYYTQRFGGSIQDTEANEYGAAWRRDVSPVRSLDAADPPFLLLFAEGDYPALHRQARLTGERLGALGLDRGVVLVRGVDHERIVLALSRADHTAARAVLRFLRETPCPR